MEAPAPEIEYRQAENVMRDVSAEVMQARASRETSEQNEERGDARAIARRDMKVLSVGTMCEM
eukprot:scaffold10451_cov121-Isochrysis_galbana.AAC.5